ncbi:MAG: hypothetical protein NC548_45840 [Lachnospiraceae bacterium]|nr:hypothetical protein [Lachnospiraceae bacterium]
MQNKTECVQPLHTNAFLELNGVPYLVAEYMDKDAIQQIDRSLIKSDIFIDQSEAMRAVVDISVDDIGIRASDKLPAIMGNNTKQKNLLKAVANYAEQFNNQLITLKRGILLRVNYRLENIRTRETIRSTSEDIRITDRNCFLDVNPRDLNDNAIVVNFSDSMVSTMTTFTHGTDQMMIRITDINMFYEALGNGPNIPRPKPVMSDFVRLPTTTQMNAFDYYAYQMEHQHHHCWDPHHRPPMDWDGNYGREPVDCITPSPWMMFNRYYHFDNNGKDIIIHPTEVVDQMAPIALVPCGTIKVNRVFRVNPGHRIVFKFSIWKNDLVLVNDTTRIARALKAPYLGDIYDCSCDCNQDNSSTENSSCNCGCDHTVEPDKETILRMLAESRKMNNKQNFVINQLMETVEDLNQTVKNLICGEKPPCCGQPDNTVCTVGGKSFTTIQEAIEAVENHEVKGEITLMSDVTEYLTIRGDVTIDLNGHDIAAPKREDTSAYYHTILVDGGNLTINGDGIVSNENHQGYCVMNAAAGDTWLPDKQVAQSMGEGTVTLNGGKYVHSTNDPNHRSYVIVNRGARMTINASVVVDTELDDSSLVTNGFQKDVLGNPIMIINGGKFRGGRHTINNDHGGKMIINDGIFSMGTPWPDVDFASGPKNVFRNEEDSIAQIKGGTFSGNVENSNLAENSLQISGGKFTVDVSDFIVDGKKQSIDGTVVPEE